MSSVWHENDRFWETFYPVMFHQDRWEAASLEVEQAVSFLGLEEGMRVLDLCCGPGRHTVELAKRGYAVTGVDRTVRFIEIAGEKAREAGVDPELLVEDARSFCRPKAFDAAINVYTSFGYFEDPLEDRQLLWNLHSSLSEGGRVLIDMSGKEVVARAFEPTSTETLPDGTILEQKRHIEPGWEWLRSTWVLKKGGDTYEMTFRHRVYSGVELKAVLMSVGFEDVRLYGSLEGIPYDNQARRLVAVARKP